MNCNRILLLSLFLFITSGVINSARAQSFNFGIKGGLNISSHLNNFRYVDGDIDLDLKPHITSNYQAGIILRKDFSRVFRIQTEPSLIMLGAKYKEGFILRGFEFQTESMTELLYLHLPLLFQLSTDPTSKSVRVHGRDKATTTYHLTGGFYGGYLLDARFSGTNTGAPIGISFEGDFSNDVKSQYAEYDGGAVLGVGFEYGSRQKIGFETRALYGVLNSGNAPALSFEPHNVAITFSVYLLF